VFVGASCVFAIVYVAGIPCTLLCILYRNKMKIQKDPDNPELKAKLGSLYHQYEPEYWYFEIVQMMRKMILTGGLMVFKPGSPIQIVAGVLVCFFYLVLWINTKPFVMEDEDRLEQVASVQLFVSLLLGLILKYRGMVEFEQSLRSAEVVKSTEDQALDVFLVLLNVVVLVFGLVTILLSLGFVKKTIKNTLAKAKDKKAEKQATKDQADAKNLKGRHQKIQPENDETEATQQSKDTQVGILVIPVANARVSKTESIAPQAPVVISNVVSGGIIEIQQPRPVSASLPEDGALESNMLASY